MREPLHPSKQDRSRKTQERILAATARLLKEHSFESISVRRIVAEANTSTGSFYARFRDKSALLPVLYADYERQLEVRLTRLQAATADAATLDEVAELFAQHLVATVGEIPNLSRALYDYATRSPKSAEAKALGKRRRKQYGFVIDALLSFRDEITHPDPERAADLGLYFVAVVCRNRLLYPMAPQTQTLAITQRELRTELARLLTGYLRA